MFESPHPLGLPAVSPHIMEQIQVLLAVPCPNICPTESMIIIFLIHKVVIILCHLRSGWFVLWHQILGTEFGAWKQGLT